jgi:hypothetical protein
VTPTAPKPIQQSFDGSVQELPGMGQVPPVIEPPGIHIPQALTPEEIAARDAEAIAMFERGGNRPPADVLDRLSAPKPEIEVTPRTGSPLPPKEPPIPPTPLAPKPADFKGQPIDLFGARPLDAAMQEADTLGGKARRVLSRSSDPIDAFKQEVNRTHNIVNNLEAVAAQKIAAIEATGLRTAVGADGQLRFTSLPGEPFPADLIRGSTPEARAAWDSLTWQNKAAIADYGAYQDSLNGNIAFHKPSGLAMREFEGIHFPTVVTGKDGVMKINLNGGRAVGAKQGFQHALTNESVDLAVSRGFGEADWKQAAMIGARQKARVAEDAYLTSLVKPLGLTAKNLPEGAVPGITHLQIPGVPSLQGTFFEPQLAKEIAGVLTPQNSSPGVWKALEKVNRYATPIRASMDFSSIFQQLMGTWVTHPGIALKSVVTMFKSLKNPDVYTNEIAAIDREGPGLLNLSRWVHFTPDANAGEFTLPSIGGNTKVGDAINKAFEVSNQAFSRPQNIARGRVANLEYAKATNILGLSGDALEAHMEAAGKSIDRMTGWTKTNLTQSEKALMFAPRYFRANLEQLAVAFTKGGVEGSIAREHLVKLLGAATAVTIIANQARGYNTSLDPRSYNFLRIRNVAGQDISMLGPFNTLVRAMAISVAGNATNNGEAEKDTGLLGITFGGAAPAPNPHAAIWGQSGIMRSKASPAVGTLWSLFSGSNFNGQPFDFNSPAHAVKALVTVGQESAPFAVQAAINEGPMGGLASATGLQSSPMSPAENRGFARDAVAQKTFGMGYDALSGAQKSQVNEDPKVAGYQSEADSNTLTREGSSAQMLTLTTKLRTQLDAASAELQSGQISGNDWRTVYHTMQDQLAGARQMITSMDSSLTPYFALRDQATQPDGTVDYTQLDALQASYEAQHPGTQAALDKVTGTHDSATLREYRQAQQLANQYYSIPAYRGMTLADSQTAGQTLSVVQAMVSYGQARTAGQAIAMIGKQNPAMARLARIAQNRGSNPARKVFRRANPALAKFYSDALVA